jgi:hypothetical protein
MFWAQVGGTTLPQEITVHLQDGGKSWFDLVWPSIAAALTALAVVFVGARITRRNLDRQWENQREHDRQTFDRGERRVLYASVIAALTELRITYSELRRIFFAPQGPHATEAVILAFKKETLIKALEATERWHHVAAEARIIGSPQFVATVDLVGQVLSAAPTPDTASDSEWEQKDEGLNVCFAAIVDVARTELGFHGAQEPDKSSRPATGPRSPRFRRTK